jgi:hypothetical protein
MQPVVSCTLPTRMLLWTLACPHGGNTATPGSSGVRLHQTREWPVHTTFPCAHTMHGLPLACPRTDDTRRADLHPAALLTLSATHNG